MSTIILSCGRTGTNMLLEILAGSELINSEISPYIEQKIFYERPKLPSNYLTKSDTHYINTENILWQKIVNQMMVKNPDLKILWTIRDLRDCALSKLYRGRDQGSGPADDATFNGCIKDIHKMLTIYKFFIKQYPSRIKLVKMEDVIINFKETIEGVCNFIGIPYEEEKMKDFTGRYRTKEKQRYKTIDKSQVELYKRVDEIYDGYFKTADINLDLLFEKLKIYLEVFEYE